VTIKDFSYSPASLTIDAGTTVVWTNGDAVGHTVEVRGQHRGRRRDDRLCPAVVHSPPPGICLR
jgi:plastocyanin